MNWCFELWCWRRLLRVPWTARRSNQSILKEIHPEYSLEGLMLKLKLQYFGHPMQRADLLEKILVLGKTDNRRGMESQDEIVEWHNWLSGANYLPLSKLQEIVKDREAWRAAVHEVTKNWTRLRNQRSNCQHPLDHRKSESSRKTSNSTLLTMPKPLTVWITTNCGKFLKRYQTTLPASWEIHVPNIPSSYAILFFIASDFTSITSHIHNRALFSLWLRLFVLSGVISPLSSSSILGTCRPGEFIFRCHTFLPFPTIHGVLKARTLKGFAIPFSSGPRFVRTLHHDPSVLGGPTRHGS